MNIQQTAYIALNTNLSSEDSLQSLTSHVMQWDQEVWILNLTPLLDYWQQQSNSSGIPLSLLWRNVLNQTFGEKQYEDRPLSIQQPYAAALANHPWKSLLILRTMQEKSLSGLISEWGKAGKRLLDECSWDIWYQNINQLSNLWEQLKLKQFKASRLRSQAERLIAIAQRTGIYTVSDSHIFNQDSLQNRFGREISNIWNWQFQSQTLSFSDRLFPWKPYAFSQPMQAQRHTEFPYQHWQQIKEDLKEDLNKLADLCSQKLVTEIRWKLRLEELEEYVLSVPFRVPHSLSAENGHQKTALLQASYAFQDHPELSSKETGGIIHWELKVLEMFQPPAVYYNIFGELLGEDTGENGLSEIANRLPVSLKRFQIHQDWSPEHSYIEQPGSKTQKEHVFNNTTLVLAEQRPLYIRAHPIAISNKTGLFLEKVMGKWWQPEGTTERTYYKYTDHHGDSYWVFRDISGNWFEHGTYG